MPLMPTKAHYALTSASATPTSAHHSPPATPALISGPSTAHPGPPEPTIAHQRRTSPIQPHQRRIQLPYARIEVNHHDSQPHQSPLPASPLASGPLPPSTGPQP
ncbi:hypothetical protein CF319_g7922 [Tilletia indica]|uniref:Uncharacterized protein n=1 Tax=Tilletia indica TaxID=43049 RepID=A0A177T6F2_9BASI|nr:hypothetical protein CF319_g7922 [Tilletia indica]KAE8238822.1 hypothetical protein A4X13_0g8364 [Tilletia indica]